MPEIRDNLEAAFVADGSATAEQAQREREARRQLVANLPGGSELRSFSCRATFCRIETSHVDKAHFKQFVEASFMNPRTSLWPAPFLAGLLGDEPGAGQPWLTVSFLAQEGHSLPMPE
jgi:hypothetical protein